MNNLFLPQDIDDQYAIFEDMRKFKIKLGTKIPLEKGWQEKACLNLPIKAAKYGIGLITGKVNNIFVVDIDYHKWDQPEEHIFIKIFGPDFIKDLDTLTIRTASGGYHLIFKYDALTAKLYQTQNEKLQIDTRSNGGYIATIGTVYPDTEFKTYSILHKADIKPMPEKLFAFIEEYLCSSAKAIKKKLAPCAITNTDNDKFEASIYNFHINSSEIEKYIISKFSADYLDKAETWRIFTRAMKFLNQKKLWDETSQKFKNYHKLNNFAIWENSKPEISSLRKILIDIDKKVLEKLCMYKPLPENIRKPDQYINQRYIQTDKNKNDFFKDNVNYVVKSQKGTGKTSGFFAYAAESNFKFISIVSRVSLCDEQFNDYYKINNNILHYKNKKPNNNKNGLFDEEPEDEPDKNKEYSAVFTTIDSIKCIPFFQNEISNAIIYIDEFNSLIEYILDSETMKEKRITVFSKFVNLLFSCKQFICTDADISEISIKFINYITQLRNDKYIYIENTFKPNTAIDAAELYTYEDLINTVNFQNKYLVCCDTKRMAEKIHHDLAKLLTLSRVDTEEMQEYINISYANELNIPLRKLKTEVPQEKQEQYKLLYKLDKIKIITSDTIDIDKLDNYEKLIISPKVIYGLDSQMSRKVFCAYDQSTISSANMLQQLSRCRNIESLYFYFTHKEFLGAKYKTLDDCTKHMTNVLEFCDKYYGTTEDVNHSNIFNQLYAIFEYKRDADNSNKYVHFKMKLLDEGFNIVSDLLQSSSSSITIKEKQQNIALKAIQHIYDVKAKNNGINSEFRFPEDRFTELYEKYKEYIFDANTKKRHENIIYYFFNNSKYDNTDDFQIHKIKSRFEDYQFLDKIKKLSGFKIDENNYISCSNAIDASETLSIIEEYNAKFRNRSTKNITLATAEDTLKFITGIYDKLFPHKESDKKIILSEQKSKNNKRITFYKFNVELLAFEEELYMFKNSSYKPKYFKSENQ